MTKPTPNLVEDSIKSYKSSKEYPDQKAKGMSFFAFLLSIFVSISIFYIFHLSPSTLFNTTKFWFFISNTLILIIAADYGVFSSSKPKQDFYEEFMIKSQLKNPSSIVLQHPQVVKESTTNKEEVDNFQEKQVIYIAKESDSENPSHQEDLQEKIHAKTYRRSKSEKTKRVGIGERKNIVRWPSETEKHEPSVEENDQFSTMSDAELDRRFEEFIQRFNRQIRLQRTRNFRPNFK